MTELISPENKKVLVKRSKSFAWRTGMMILAGALDFVLNSLGLINMPGQVTIILGLVLGEVSKQINAKLSANQQ